MRFVRTSSAEGLEGSYSRLESFGANESAEWLFIKFVLPLSAPIHLTRRPLCRPCQFSQLCLAPSFLQSAEESISSFSLILSHFKMIRIFRPVEQTGPSMVSFVAAVLSDSPQVAA